MNCLSCCNPVYVCHIIRIVVQPEHHQELRILTQNMVILVRLLLYVSIFYYKQMLFSLLFLNRYHGMEEQQVDFDHRYHYDNQKKELRISQGKEGKIPHFYGKAVSSLSCIVGKNGTGKSSTVDFLRETFLRLIKLIEETDIVIENGYIKKVTS